MTARLAGVGNGVGIRQKSKLSKNLRDRVRMAMVRATAQAMARGDMMTDILAKTIRPTRDIPHIQGGTEEVILSTLRYRTALRRTIPIPLLMIALRKLRELGEITKLKEERLRRDRLLHCPELNRRMTEKNIWTLLWIPQDPLASPVREVRSV
jgi:hypothetical protein